MNRQSESLQCMFGLLGFCGSLSSSDPEMVWSPYEKPSCPRQLYKNVDLRVHSVHRSFLSEGQLLNILLGIQRLWRGGGTETHVLTLGERLKTLGHQVTVYTSGGEWVEKVRGTGVAVETDSRLFATHKEKAISAQFEDYLTRHHFDVLHAHDTATLRLFARAKHKGLTRGKLVFTLHGGYVDKSSIALANREASHIIAVSSAIRKSHLSDVSEHKLHVVPNGIRTDEFRPNSGKSQLRQRLFIPSEAFVIGYCSRFTFDKMTLGKRVIRALRAYAARYHKVHIIVAGRGAKQVISKNGRLHVMGHIEHMQSLINACDVMIATGRTAAESLLCGVPVLAVGKAGYQGVVTPRNIEQMIQTNFSDHGQFHTWTSEKLQRDIQNMRRKFHRTQKDTARTRKLVQGKLSASRMASRIESIYQAT